MIYDFTSCFLFSVETQTTIGYGDRVVTEECPEAIFLVGFQSIVGLMIDGYFGGILIGKLCRPKERTQTLLVSKKAVINKRDGSLYLMFRIGDIRKNFLINVNVRALLIYSKATKEEEILEPYIEELKVSIDENNTGELFLMWPTTIVHKIDSTSPFWNVSAGDLPHGDFEIVVVLEGTQQTTGQDVQCRASFVPSEILWGHRFEEMIGVSEEWDAYDVDFSKLDKTVKVDVPLCSAAELGEKEGKKK